MSSERVSTAVKWIERFAQSVDAVKTSGEAKPFLSDLLGAALVIARAGRGHAIAMEGDTVVAEVARTATGDAFDIESEARKTAARLALRASEKNGSSGRFHGIEALGGRQYLTFTLSGRTACTLVLERIDGPIEAELQATAALALAASRIHSNGHATRPRESEAAVAAGGVGAVAYLKPVVELERDAIELALRTTSWNKEEAARRLGISRASIYMKVKKWGLQKPPVAST